MKETLILVFTIFICKCNNFKNLNMHKDDSTNKSILIYSDEKVVEEYKEDGNKTNETKNPERNSLIKTSDQALYETIILKKQDLRNKLEELNSQTFEYELNLENQQKIKKILFYLGCICNCCKKGNQETQNINYATPAEQIDINSIEKKIKHLQNNKLKEEELKDLKLSIAECKNINKEIKKHEDNLKIKILTKHQKQSSK